ncbi:unnamed protein product [Pneumocystis jirovecii]|uniref:Cytochrome c oxidase assembly factor 5 n=2 Tax=Pneumocystis jirovecii TaxID=42068 RepID=L0PD80_PNEJI|nr:uncharacterized protein T551_02559 [Pneumocystis jirovecii RU7]KTW28709.1 hypothetical protein T551_02559 [Pneumocystis jirovecii RU7]CCJ30044.1 unnamed protein product [Pneumocystis jirovecii]
MPSSCSNIREALASCILDSDCMKKGNTAKECLSNPELLEFVPLQCFLLKRSLFDCKRGMLDMRKRFRGNVSISIDK